MIVLPVLLELTKVPDWYLPSCAAFAVGLLLLLITRLRMHPAVALIVAAFGLGIISGMPLTHVPEAFAAGVGNLLGHIAIVLGLGAVLGGLLARSGGAGALGSALVERCGPRGLPWALFGLGILVGMPVFFEVGLVLLMPIVASAARRTGRPAILVGMPLLAGLSIVHGTLPPHPAAMLAATQYHADLGRTILWGLTVGLPSGVVAGPLLAGLLGRVWMRKGRRSVESHAGPALFAEEAGRRDGTEGNGADSRRPDSRRPDAKEPDANEPDADEPDASGPRATQADARGEPLPQAAGAVRAACAVLLPIGLIFLGSWADTLTAPGGWTNRVMHFVGSPDVALLIAVLAALASLGPHIQTEGQHRGAYLRQVTNEAFAPIASVLVILAAAGGLSGVLRESGAAQATVSLALGAHIPPLVLAWLLAAIVRISMGSATVAMAVASGVLAPMTGHVGVPPELLVLATGTGSLILSHVNDPGFWLIQSFFRMDTRETLATWSLLETVLSVAGLCFTLLVSGFLH